MKQILFLFTFNFLVSAYALSPGQFSVSFSDQTFNLDTVAVEPEQVSTLEEFDAPVRFELVYISDIKNINQIDTKNKIILTDRGVTTFANKFEIAQSSGAAGIVVVNILSDGIFPMVLTNSLMPIRIYGLMISGSDGAIIKKQLETGNPFFITIQPAQDKSL